MDCMRCILRLDGSELHISGSLHIEKICPLVLGTFIALSARATLFASFDFFQASSSAAFFSNAAMISTKEV
jgi:hypothetical protein